MPKAQPDLSPAGFTLEPADPATDGGKAVLSLTGSWVINRLPGMAAKLSAAVARLHEVTVRSDHLDALDTAGALILSKAVAGRLSGEIFNGQDAFADLYRLVSGRLTELQNSEAAAAPRGEIWAHPVFFFMVWIGRLLERFQRGFVAQSVFMGHIITQLMISMSRPHKLRVAALVNVMQRAGIDAIPIVTLTSFFLGGVIGFIGVLQLQQYGGGIFAIDMVCFMGLREFAPLITAVLMAGRSASAFAAEVGAMKMNQEIDAMRVMGIDPYEALVVPRLLALIIMEPLVTMISALAFMFGGMLAIWSALGAGPAVFSQRLFDYIPFVNFFVGIVRPPFFAATIAIVGCWQGMNVKDDVLSLGRQVTTAVVQSIFLVFLLDAIFAMLFNGFNF